MTLESAKGAEGEGGINRVALVTGGARRLGRGIAREGYSIAVTRPPEPAICKECDLKMLCHAEGIVGAPAAGRGGPDTEVDAESALPSRRIR
ncbi:MAG: hypothetical protein HY039_00455 [Nitrospirae bacterium]|nr:hypothetical protein [Nitrospirota bacterium]